MDSSPPLLKQFSCTPKAGQLAMQEVPWLQSGM